MSMVLVKTRDMERGEWLEWRRRGIGGSDAPKIVGVSRYGTAFTLYLQKLGEVEPDPPGEEAEWGLRLEPVVAQKFEEVTGLKVRKVNKMLRHPEYPFIIGNIDRKVVGRNEGLELKCTKEWRRSEWDDDNVPDDYYIQCQHYMAVTGYPRWWIAVLIGGSTFRYKCIERNDELISALIEAEKQFWWHVEHRVPPPPDGSDMASEFLAKLHPTSNGHTIDLPPEAQRWIKQYDEASAEEAEAKARKEEAANRLKALLGEYERGRFGDRTVTWKTVVSRHLDTKALKAEMPEVYERYLRATETRRFTLK